MLGLDAGLDEFVLEMNRVRDARLRTPRSCAARRADANADDIADEFRAVDTLGKLALDVIALPCVNASEVRRARREYPSRDEEARA